MKMSELRHSDGLPMAGRQPYWPGQLDRAERDAWGDGTESPPARISPHWVRVGELVAGIVGGLTGATLALLGIGAITFSGRVLW